MRKATLLQERRRNNRIILTQQSKWKLYLYADGEYHEVQSVWDISPFGAGLQISGAVEKGTEVRLKYQVGGVDLRVCGLVIWSSVFDENPGTEKAVRSYRVGIAFRPEDAKENTHFFRYLTSE
ncbi:MAG: PilZ domain-containing protein [Gammaproteobacteria bacterium]